MTEITPDTKDWTWVLERPCPECGFEASSVTPDAVGALVRAVVPRYVEVLARPDARDRPAPDVWSALEYGAHVRDVFGVFDVRLASMVEGDAPEFANWDQDATALADDYASQEPAVVARELEIAADRVAGRFDAVVPDQWERPGLRSNGSRFTVRTLGQYFAHDVVHHLHDVGAR
ncbi:DinB family protein [Sediminihabitans luteus]|uniref:DinB family protein n=1 Tax=Sediminihabitans luteus TaxID=1138585 RepID=A0A2M9D0I3_9CELL|nr:DinB family protein [Sediminihabitans luteus]PJJ77702.1 DinB family protein [Sediminihabitans luteus]GIJ00071.1 methyltransferase type 12 [Sediminihabitans luteus]